MDSIPKATTTVGIGRYVNLLVTLAHRTRLTILELLSKGALPLQEIHAEVRVERTLLSHHLRYLRIAGLVEARREGKTFRYRLAPAIMRALEDQSIGSGCCELRFERSQKESALCNGHSFSLMIAICLLTKGAQIENRVRLQAKEKKSLRSQRRIRLQA